MDEQRPEVSRDETGESIPCDRPPDAFVSPLMAEADEAFHRDFPQLMQERPGEWVAYHGSECIGFAPTKDLLVRECLGRGLKRGDFFVTCVEPQDEIQFAPGAIWDIFHGPSLNPPDAFVSPKMIQADEAFRRDFPRLSKERPGEWVAYDGPELIGFAPRKDQLVHECLERGLKRGEFLVTCVEPEDDLMFGAGAFLGTFFGGQE
jgi:hypothetical protein